MKLHGGRFLSNGLLLLALLCTNSIAADINLAQPFTAHYDVLRNGDRVGEASISLHPIGGDQWRYQTNSRAKVFFLSFNDSETTLLQFEQNRIKPLRFERHKIYPAKSSVQEQEFNWKTMIETGHKDQKKHWSTVLEIDVLDRHSQTLLLRRDLAAGLKAMHYKIAENGKIKTYSYLVTREEVIDTAFGALPTLVVERDRATDERQTIGWYATSLDYLPVKVQQIENGKQQAEMRISAVQR